MITLMYLVAAVALGISVLFILYRLTLTKGSPATATGFWKDHAEDMKALGFIALALIIINWVLSLGGWRWWQIGWNHPPLFFGTQLAILFACYVPMFSKKTAATIFAYIVLLASLGSWVHVAWIDYDLQPLCAGHWTTFYARDGKTFHFRPEYGIPFDYMVDGNPTVHHSGPNGELVGVAFTKSLDVRPFETEKARVYYTDDP